MTYDGGELMKKYIAFFRLRFAMGLQYRSAALAGMVTQFVWGAMEILVFHAFHETGADAFPMSLSATASYVWMQQAFLAFFMVYFMENELFDAIKDGNIAYELCRPVHIYDMWFARSIANRASRAALRCAPILLVAAFLPKPYGISAPADLKHFLLFLLTMFLGILAVVAFCMIVYGLTFFTFSPEGLRIFFYSVTEFFTGAVIPLPFFPDPIRRIMEYLPFAAMQNVPLRIYSGSMTDAEMLRAAGLQVFWLIVMILFGRLLFSCAERRVTVQGG